MPPQLPKLTWTLIVFYNGKKRKHYRVADPKKSSKLATVLTKRGHKAHLICSNHILDGYEYPPAKHSVDLWEAGMLWCPYCRRWRWFAVPRSFKDHSLFEDSPQGMMNTWNHLGIKCCTWCLISVEDWYVKRANGLFGQEQRKPKRSRKRKSRFARR